MTRTRITPALAAIAVGIAVLAGCYPAAEPTPTASVTSKPTPTPTYGTKVPPPADENEAIAAAENTVDAWFVVWSEIEVTGSEDLTPLETVSTGRALQIAQNGIRYLRTGPYPDENGKPVDGPATAEGRITFETQSAYGQAWEETDNGLVTITACQDISERIITTNDGTPGQRNENPRNVVEYKVIYDASKGLWLVQDQIDLQQTC